MASKAGRLQIQLDMQVAQLQRDLDKANRMIADSTGNWKKSFTSVFTGTLATDFFNKLTGAMAQTITDLGDIADKSVALGDTAEMFQRLAYAADQSGVAMETVVSASGKLQKSLGEGGEKAAQALNTLGLSIDQLRKLSTGDAFIKVAGAMGSIQDKALQAATGTALFGKGWQALLPLAAQGEQALRAMAQQAQVASDAAVQAADEYGDAIAAMQGSVKVFIAEALAPLLPLLTQSAKEFTNVAGNASGAADGVDRTTSSARQLGETLAGMLQGLQGFRDLLNAIQETSRVRAFKWPWEEGELAKGPEVLDKIANAWSRMTTNFVGVHGAVSSTEEITNAQKEAAKAAQAAADAAGEQAAADAKGAAARVAKTKATKDNNDAEKAALQLQRDAAALQREADARAERETDLINERTYAIARFNGVSEDEIEIMRMKAEGRSEAEIALVREIQGYDAAAAASQERAQALADQAHQYFDVIGQGFADIFGSMTEGADETKEAIVRLIAELMTLWATQKLLAAAGFGANGSWGWGGVAKGAAFDQRGMMAFAQGGIVRSATPFTFGGGRRGVMGEAGPEAVLPLGRDSAGRLGVRGGGVTVNVHNNNGSQIGVEQRGGEINVIVEQVRSVIANDFARGGNMVTTAFEGAYGVRR